MARPVIGVIGNARLLDDRFPGQTVGIRNRGFKEITVAFGGTLDPEIAAFGEVALQRAARR